MSLRSMIANMTTALGVVLAAAPGVAQQTAPTNQATPTPSPGTIGNPALENFNLNGTVTREGATPPTRTPPATATPAPPPTPSPSPTPTVAAPAPTTPRASSDAAAPARDAAPRTSPRDVAAPSASVPADLSPTAPAPDVVPQAPDLMPPAPAPSGSSPWPWLALLAVALGAGGAWWLRRQKQEGENLAYAAPVADAPVAAPVPAPTERPAPLPPAPPSDGITTRVGAGIGSDGGIVSRALQPRLAFDLEPLKFETDDRGNVRLTFELVVVNVGSAPARDIRVEAKLFNAGPDQDRQIGMFFKAPGAMGAKLPPIGPRDRMPLRSRVGMTADDYQALSMGGRSLVIPMLAVNAVYRGSGGETQESASWLVGARPSSEEADKLKPFPLDRPIVATALQARTHSAGLQNQA